MLLCIVLVQLPLRVLFPALMSSGVGHTALAGVIAVCLFLVGACGAFCSLGLVAMACLLLQVVLLALLMLIGLTRRAAVGDERHLVSECNALAPLRSWYAGLFMGSTDTMRSLFAQPNYMGIFHYIVDCLDFIEGQFEYDCHAWLADSCKILLLHHFSAETNFWEEPVFCMFFSTPVWTLICVSALP